MGPIMSQANTAYNTKTRHSITATCKQKECVPFVRKLPSPVNATATTAANYSFRKRRERARPRVPYASENRSNILSLNIVHIQYIHVYSRRTYLLYYVGKNIIFIGTYHVQRTWYMVYGIQVYIYYCTGGQWRRCSARSPTSGCTGEPVVIPSSAAVVALLLVRSPRAFLCFRFRSEYIFFILPYNIS